MKKTSGTQHFGQGDTATRKEALDGDLQKEENTFGLKECVSTPLGILGQTTATINNSWNEIMQN